MSKGRLTRQELGWLLTQEAQNAAERLRVGVQVLRTHGSSEPPSAPTAPTADDPAAHVETSLDALDDVMRMLSSLHQRQSASVSVTPRRGRIDLAALIVEVAPDARVSIEPGSGTEVFGDEGDFRRMLQVLIGHGPGEGSSITVRRDGDDVRVSTVLGPDLSPTAETERSWLSRMVTRYGGRHELEGGNETLVLPAELETDRSERETLRRELDEARKQGEVYARELAAVFDRGEEPTSLSSRPPGPPEADGERLALLTKLCAGIAGELGATLGPLAKELGAARRHELTDEQLDTFRRRVTSAQRLASSLRAVGDVQAHELATELDLFAAATSAVEGAASAAERGGVALAGPAASADRAYVRCGAKALSALSAELVSYAVAASPRGTTVTVSVTVGQGEVRFVVDDAGPALPASARRGLLALDANAGAHGRPSALAIFMAAELAASMGASLELSDAPSGLRVAVTFAKS